MLDSAQGLLEGLWGAVSDPGGTVAAMAPDVTHPVDTLKVMVAWADWAAGRGDRALGKITGDVVIAAAIFGAGELLMAIVMTVCASWITGRTPIRIS
ncbi:hypothetical protein P3102_15805 [Amycolatopsis sp. QT-25]|uniref:hypothetical protein n=1 Tax=Amycolatopsis sp. QT-25 TaxID=3034022 RepID=UPI0023EB2007|nr:hypothetical protein [Amycolatopsis sp. QT-25]WET82562.1 hypothetical protein P3102_15805 [Amycolatopsis sp. QT-25]